MSKHCQYCRKKQSCQACVDAYKKKQKSLFMERYQQKELVEKLLKENPNNKGLKTCLQQANEALERSR